MTAGASSEALHLSRITGPASLNRIRILTGGSQTFQSLNYRLASAKRSIYMSAYIFHSDYTGQRIANTLMRKAQDGLDVRLFLDAWGSMYFTEEMEVELKNAGVRVEYFRRFEILRPYRHLLRNHRRMIIVDSQMAMTGGFAIQDIWADIPETRIKDMQLWVTGPIVQEIEALFAYDWCQLGADREDPMCGDPALRRLGKSSEVSASPGSAILSPGSKCNPLSDHCEGFASLLVTGPTENRAGNYEFYLRALAASRQRIWLVTPYFVPDDRFMKLLGEAADRGVDVRLLVASSNSIEEFPVSYVRNSYLEDLLESGARVYTYEAGFLHTKAALFDDGLSIIGTSNLDRRSFDYNHEIDIVSFDRNINQAVEVVFMRYLEDSREIALSEMSDRSLWIRALEFFWLPLTPQL